MRQDLRLSASFQAFNNACHDVLQLNIKRSMMLRSTRLVTSGGLPSLGKAEGDIQQMAGFSCWYTKRQQHVVGNERREKKKSGAAGRCRSMHHLGREAPGISI